MPAAYSRLTNVGAMTTVPAGDDKVYSRLTNVGAMTIVTIKPTVD